MASETAPTGRSPGRPDDQLDPGAERALRRRLGSWSGFYHGVSAQDFDDMYQEAWVKLLEGKNEGKRMRSREGVLRWGVGMSWSQELRKRRRRPAVALDGAPAAALIADGADPVKRTELLEATRCLFESVGAVTERQWEIFLLADVFGLRPPEIQQRLGISERVYQRNHQRALRTIRRSVRELLAGDWCDQYREPLDAHAAGKASASQEREAHRHLVNCPACKRTLAVRRATGAEAA